MTKVAQAPACVVRAFLNDANVWKDVHVEDEEFLVNGESRTDLENVADSEAVTIRGGDVYWRNDILKRKGSLNEHFTHWLESSGTIVLVKTNPARQAELLELLQANGFEFEVAAKG